jgi:hypothetical protein
MSWADLAKSHLGQFPVGRWERAESLSLVLIFITGHATKVVGCGTLIATSGSFTGSATIIGCGSASGYATLDGTGTVYPAALGGMIGITSSGIVTGSGSVIGCGTIV